MWTVGQRLYSQAKIKFKKTPMQVLNRVLIHKNACGREREKERERERDRCQTYNIPLLASVVKNDCL